MTKTPAERTLDSEVRAVESGRHARLAGDGRHFAVRSETVPGATYKVSVRAVGDTVVWQCDHGVVLGIATEPARTFVPCAHGSLCARRLEREGLLRWEHGRWLPTAKAYELGVPEPAVDPFEGIGFRG